MKLRPRGLPPERLLSGIALAALLLGAPSARAVGPGDVDAAQGLAAEKRGDCVKAIPLLEQAELVRHRPSTAVALARCYVATGELIQAVELYESVVRERPLRTWKREDVQAHRVAAKKAAEVLARIPTLRFESAETYEDLEITVDGKPVDPLGAKRLPSDKRIVVSARAQGRSELTEKIVLAEGERRVLTLRLPRRGAPSSAEPPPAPPPEKTPEASAHPAKPSKFLGVRYRGVLLPPFVMNAAVDGGTTVVAPGGALSLTLPSNGTDFVLSIGTMSFAMPDTPFKGHGAPDTEWEFVAADLHTMVAELDVLWNFPLDADRRFNLRLGGGLGVGFVFAGNVFRTQAYPANGRPGDPATYRKCRGPNQPRGTFRYCNKLDKDATHYDGYTDTDWFHGGLKPIVFPWVVLPEVALSYRVTERVVLDLETGLTLTGFLMGGGFRYAL